ncbi:MAG: peptidoglycan DD-metalloendopeptidase family protein [Ardenticatenaceae bacterium]|nr:peptidoglycan DD-metalloendopeptidase family protein [Ardenticatenaceae bacterium]
MTKRVMRLSLFVASCSLVVVLLLVKGEERPLQAAGNVHTRLPRVAAAERGYETLLDPAQPPSSFVNGTYTLPYDDEDPAVQQALRAQLDANIQTLQAQGYFTQTTPLLTPFLWPVRASGTNSHDNFYVSVYFVDHNPVYPDQLLDYQCGMRTYDLGGYNHAGTDIVPWPFPWQQVDNDGVEVIAAAAGIIVLKQDGYSDRNCAFNGESNAIYLRHSDGSESHYKHMKLGSLTNKGVGDTVAAGEYLGVVASSGNSTGPHLHFEVYDPQYDLVDPFSGTCNTLNAESWWITQNEYYESAISKLTTGDAAPVSPTCPAPMIDHIVDSFAPGDEVFFTVYYRDLLSTLGSQLTIYRPNGTVFQQWTYQPTAPFQPVAFPTWSYELPANAPGGTWRFTANFNGEMYETFFNVGAPTYIDLSAPNGGEVWTTGSTRPIFWEDNLGGEVRLELYRNGSYVETLARKVESNGRFNWAISTNLLAGDGYQVRIVDLADESVFDMSDANFSLSGGPAILVTSPNGHETWPEGLQRPVTWVDNLDENVRLELYRNGTMVRTLATSTPSDGVFTWTIPPELTGTGYRLRVTAVSDVTVFDESDDPFAIVGPLDEMIFLPLLRRN